MTIINRVLILCALAPGLLLADKTFQAGEMVEKEYAASWYPGTVTEIGSGKNAGWYKVRDAKTGSETWADGRRMRGMGQKLATTFTLSPNDTFGTWGLGAAATTIRETSSGNYRDTVGSSGGSLTISPDGTYSWKIGGGTITGKWRTEPRPERYRGPVILEKGWSDRNWWVNYEGRNEAGNDSIYIRSDANTTYSGFRYK